MRVVLPNSIHASTRKVFVTTVYLVKHSNSQEHPFWCPDCRNMILQYRGEVIKLAPGSLVDGEDSTLPLTVMCSNTNCKRKYQFVSFVGDDYEL